MSREELISLINTAFEATPPPSLDRLRERELSPFPEIRAMLPRLREGQALATGELVPYDFLSVSYPEEALYVLPAYLFAALSIPKSAQESNLTGTFLICVNPLETSKDTILWRFAYCNLQQLVLIAETLLFLRSSDNQEFGEDAEVCLRHFWGNLVLDSKALDFGNVYR